MNSDIGTVVLGNEYQALGLLRQLHAHGVRCVLVDQDAWGLARFSRYCSVFHQSPRYVSDEFWPWLAGLARHQKYIGWVLVPTDDEQVRQLAEHHGEVKQLFRYDGMPWSTYRVLYDKRLTHKWVEELGVKNPKTFLPRDRRDVPKDELQFPFIVKPAIKREYSRYCKKKAIPVRTRLELEELLDGELHRVPVDQLLYQDIIPGGGQNQWSYAGFFVRGEPVAAFTARRWRQHPTDFGRASTYVVAEYDGEVEGESRRILSALGLTGLAEVEWKRDPRDGKLKFLEVNARSWGWHSLSSRVVGNLAAVLYDYLVFDKIRYAKPRYGARWVKWITDLPVAAVLLSRREITPAKYVQGVWGNLVACEWDHKDPLPFLLQFGLVPYLLAKRGY